MALRDTWLAGKQQRQQQCIERQQVVQQMLTEFNQTRQSVASELQSDLTLFREGLNQRNRDRQADFQLFEAELQAFHQQLQSSMRSLRNQLSLDLATLKTETQLFLTTCQQQRAQTNVAMRQALSQFVEHLRADTYTYLVELELLRQQRADHIQQNLRESRQTRAADVATLFAQLAEFRAELEQFHRSIGIAVWGQFASTDAKLPQAAGEQLRQSAIPTAPLSSKPAAPVAVGKRPATKTSITSRPVAAKTPLKATRKLTAASTSSVAPGTSTAEPNQSALPINEPEVAFEKEVYTFLHNAEGGRLTQIETALNLNRFQAVDALRSLIKKGLITQRDRVYLVQQAL